jgi:glycosyltransferase involved in cell wall biosynthesis
MPLTEITILRELLAAESGFVSGTRLAKSLGISRVAVWMQLQKLTKQGFTFEAVRSRAARLPNVEFTGFLPLEEVERWFDRARLLVLTSVYEGMPNVFLQAWARGVPTVATVDVGAAVNMVFGDVAQGAARVETLLSDNTLWSQAANDCLAYFERNHSASEVLGRYARLFDELAEK